MERAVGVSYEDYTVNKVSPHEWFKGEKGGGLTDGNSQVTALPLSL